MATPRGMVRWILRANVNRRMRTDYTLAEELVIYGASAQSVPAGPATVLQQQ